MFANTTPCDSCPFRKDHPYAEGWLGKKRMTEIIEETVMGDGTFQCHKTYQVAKDKKRLCAGKLILEERVNPGGNFMTRLAKMAGYLPEAFVNTEVVFQTAEEAINYHAEE